MQAEEPKLSLAQLALLQSQAVAMNLLLIDESVVLLMAKRTTLEERNIAKYFHKIACVYAAVINLLHNYMSEEREFGQSIEPALNRLRTVNENVRSCIEELLKIIKYNLNYLEQYFEYDFCSQLLSNQELLFELEDIQNELKSQLGQKIL